jgi:nucleoside-diphosphate-sugar epimerase
MTLHVIVGAGPVGSLTASLLVQSGQDVRIVTRRGDGPDHPRIERVHADASVPDVLRPLVAGAAALYDAASPPYHRWASDWPPLAASLLSAAQGSGAVLVTVSNLYAYGPSNHPMKESDVLAATTTKGSVRARIWHDALAAHHEGRVRATELRSSDYFGPHVLLSELGERIIPKLLAGKQVRVLGDPDMPHSWTYIWDVARALTVLGSDQRAWGRAWHTPTNPPLTQREIIASLCTAADVPLTHVRTIPALATRALGVFVPVIRELAEVRYQFEMPFIVDSSAAQSTFGLVPTPMAKALAETVSWYREAPRNREQTHDQLLHPA